MEPPALSECRQPGFDRKSRLQNRAFAQGALLQVLSLRSPNRKRSPQRRTGGRLADCRTTAQSIHQPSPRVSPDAEEFSAIATAARKRDYSCDKQSSFFAWRPRTCPESYISKAPATIAEVPLPRLGPLQGFWTRKAAFVRSRYRFGFRTGPSRP